MFELDCEGGGGGTDYGSSHLIAEKVSPTRGSFGRSCLYIVFD